MLVVEKVYNASNIDTGYCHFEHDPNNVINRYLLCGNTAIRESVGTLSKIIWAGFEKAREKDLYDKYD